MSSRSLAITVAHRGPPDVLQAEVRDVRLPARGQVLVRILASSVSQPDVQARYGRTPFPPGLPFVPGYTYVGDIVALGPGVTSAAVGDRVGALAIVGGYAEHALADANRDWFAGLPAVGQVLAWILLLPIAIGLWAWQADLHAVALVLVAVGLAAWTVVALANLFGAVRGQGG